MAEERTPSGFSLEDTKAIFQVFNRAACELGGQDVPLPVIIKRLRLMSFWFGDSADRLQGISAEELGVLDCVRFWKSRAAGARGLDGDD